MISAMSDLASRMRNQIMGSDPIIYGSLTLSVTVKQILKSAEIKVRLARANKARSLVSSVWLAKALHLGTAPNIRKLLR